MAENVYERVVFTGVVQGVGFRWTTERYARRRSLTGTVRNLPTGQVEMHVSGPSSEIEGLIEDLNQHFSGQIRSIDRLIPEEKVEFSDFRILR